MKLHKVAWSLLRIFSLLFIIICSAWIALAQPSFRKSPSSQQMVSADKLESHVKKLSVDFHPRNYQEHDNLNRTAEYIFNHFKKADAEARYQGFSVGVDHYKNVVGTFNSEAAETLIIGAHYDSCADTPGADDNASGVAGLIELAYLLGKMKPNYEIELVAYTLEEPPFFDTLSMGSYHHALKSVSNKKTVKGVIVLEMIGYFSDKAGSQTFPAKFLNLMYPNRGNFIAVVSQWEDRPFTKRVKTGMKGTTPLPVYSLNAPPVIPGIDFSDHRNYWKFGIPAVMITDTSFYRNQHYHELTDTYDTLNYEKMGQVASAVHSLIQDL